MIFCLKQLDTNLPSILLQLSTNVPYALRSYAGYSDFHSKKVKKVCDINLTYAGGRFVLKIVCLCKRE